MKFRDRQRLVIREARLTPAQKLILLDISDYAKSEDGVSWPSVGTLAGHLNYSERGTRKLLRGLEEEGVLETVKKKGASSRYRVTWRYFVPGAELEDELENSGVQGEEREFRGVNSCPPRNPGSLTPELEFRDPGTGVPPKSEKKSSKKSYNNKETSPELEFPPATRPCWDTLNRALVESGHSATPARLTRSAEKSLEALCASVGAAKVEQVWRALLNDEIPSAGWWLANVEGVKLLYSFVKEDHFHSKFLAEMDAAAAETTKPWDAPTGADIANIRDEADAARWCRSKARTLAGAVADIKAAGGGAEELRAWLSRRVSDPDLVLAHADTDL